MSFRVCLFVSNAYDDGGAVTFLPKPFPCDGASSAKELPNSTIRSMLELSPPPGCNDGVEHECFSTGQFVGRGVFVFFFYTLCQPHSRFGDNLTLIPSNLSLFTSNRLRS